MATEKELLENYLATLSDKVQENIVIEGTTKPVYHISMSTDIKEFIPIIGLRQNDLEDRTVPRVCVGPDLLGCIVGYASFIYDFYNAERKKIVHPENGGRDGSFKGGWQIYGFNHEFALAPNNELVPVANYTGERWLVNYSEKTRIYEPIKIGKLFMTNVLVKATDGEYPNVVCEAYLEVNHADGIWLDVHTQLQIGYYKFTILNLADIEARDHKIDFQEIPKEMYFEAKGLSASLLSYVKPNYLDWS